MNKLLETVSSKSAGQTNWLNLYNMCGWHLKRNWKKAVVEIEWKFRQGLVYRAASSS